MPAKYAGLELDAHHYAGLDPYSALALRVLAARWAARNRALLMGRTLAAADASGAWSLRGE